MWEISIRKISLIVLQINTSVNSGSTGRIAEDIGQVLLTNGHQSYIAYGRGDRPSQSQLIKIGTKKDVIMHGLKTAIFDRHGFGSRTATEELIENIEKIQPDIIGLHNLHGYYLNIEVLFSFLKTSRIPVLWTLFDCWAFTGHCSYFDDFNCEKWKTKCHKCPKTHRYPKSYVFDNSIRNYEDKKGLFSGIENLHLLVHSQWLKGLVKQSFLSDLRVHHIPSGIDTSVFRPNDTKKNLLPDKKVVLGVANLWDARKGLKDLLNIADKLASNYQVVLIGLNKSQLKQLPKRVIGIARTESTKELAGYYSRADVFVNPTYQDNFPTTNLEALACGTPVVTYDTGGSPESIDQYTGITVKKGDIIGLELAIGRICDLGKSHFQTRCRERAMLHYNKNDRYQEYLHLYKSLLAKG